MLSSVERALERAEDAADHGEVAPVGAGAAPPRHVVMGDPQAPTARVLAVLDAHGLIGPDGWLRPDVHLISVGDHFDFGGPQEADRSWREGLVTLAWLAAHPPDRVTLLAGNHDLARVGELATTDDERFAEAVAMAVPLYRARPRDPVGERRFLRRYGEFPSVEVAARDLCSFRAVQRDWVTRLLRTGRFRLATSLGPALVTHAGVTRRDLEVLGPPAGRPWSATTIASRLNRSLDHAVRTWEDGTPLTIEGVHVPGSAADGEGGGILFHRACYGEVATGVALEPRRRRYDPRDLPAGVVQVIGHVRDPKARELLGPWVVDEPPPVEGGVRQLATDGRKVEYRAGTWPTSARDAVLMFVDGGMNVARPTEVQLLDLVRLVPYDPRSDPT